MINCWIKHRPEDTLLSGLIIIGIVLAYAPQVLIFFGNSSIGESLNWAPVMAYLRSIC